MGCVPADYLISNTSNTRVPTNHNYSLFKANPVCGLVSLVSLPMHDVAKMPLPLCLPQTRALVELEDPSTLLYI